MILQSYGLADCWTDDKLLRAQLWLRKPPKIAKLKIQPYEMLGLEKVTTSRSLKQWRVNGIRIVIDGSIKWEIMRNSLTESAVRVLGHENRRQPDWFQENIIILKQLITKRNVLFAKWLRTHHHSDIDRGM